MNIGIDFDETIDRDPELFSKWVEIAQKFGHNICIVTNNWSESREDIQRFAESVGIPVFFCGSKYKDEFMENQGIHIDVWVDDSPEDVSNRW